MQVQKMAIAWFARDTYDAARALMEDEMFATFDEWEKVVHERLAKRGVPLSSVEKVIIDPQDFAAFCRATKIKRDANGRAAYAAAVVTRKYEGRN